MSLVVTGLILFFGVHSISILNDPWRERMSNKLGIWPWKGLYSLVSIIGFVLLIQGYGLARFDSEFLYLPAPWLKHLTMLLMIPVFPLLLATYLPGKISAFVRHPMLLATILWAFSHLLVNGRLIDILLFGSFFVWAVLDLVSMGRRAQRPLPGAPDSKVNDFVALIGGLALYAVFVGGLHAVLIGVPLVG
ncbi:MAG: NnrU family protein [Deltaproteobacteria bacterium]|jgi:uncharacterized membrane protein|nr:NnrU family protein [Deltaproteobacteria bacterium]MCW8891714.1 NnrU family protein [Deltaproteobacteria bacterium]MCW9049744.1 NnrU family protein [Deltaproteobacteria bacterium]